MYDLKIKYIKRFNNIKTNILNQKSGYKNDQKLKDFIIFSKNKNNLIFNKQITAIIIKLEKNLFINKIRKIYNNNLIIKNILKYF
jgi:hypothetical protein